jgi:hypothetical protein
VRHFSANGTSGAVYIARWREIIRSVNRSSTRASRFSIEPK